MPEPALSDFKRLVAGLTEDDRSHAQLFAMLGDGIPNAPQQNVTAHGTTGVSTPWRILDAALTVISTS